MFRRNKISGPVEYLIVGLGNPDRKYENTRHNCGWLAADYIAGKLGVSVNKIKFKSFVGECTVGGRRALLMKPTTYMNNSGQAVTEAMRFYKIPPEKVIVIFDDVRIKIGIGAKPDPGWDLADWVLSKFTDSERKTLETMFDNALGAIELMADGKIDRAMNLYN